MKARILVPIALLVGLSACEGGTTLALAGAGIVSYVYTEKTLTDHAASWITEEDCSIKHAADGESYCQSAEEIAAKEDAANAALVGDQTALYCYRTLGTVTCHNRPDPLMSEQALVR